MWKCPPKPPQVDVAPGKPDFAIFSAVLDHFRPVTGMPELLDWPKICSPMQKTPYYSAKVSPERWDIAVYEGRQGYDTVLPPLCRQNGSKTRASLKMKKIREKKLVLWNYPPKSVSADAVAGRPIFPLFSADFWCFCTFKRTVMA